MSKEPHREGSRRGAAAGGMEKGCNDEDELTLEAAMQMYWTSTQMPAEVSRVMSEIRYREREYGAAMERLITLSEAFVALQQDQQQHISASSSGEVGMEPKELEGSAVPVAAGGGSKLQVARTQQQLAVLADQVQVLEAEVLRLSREKLSIAQQGRDLLIKLHNECV